MSQCEAAVTKQIVFALLITSFYHFNDSAEMNVNLIAFQRVRTSQ